MSDLQVQARALGDPTRHRIFRYIVDADRPVGVAELTQQFGFNHNAIRQHLAKLVAAGLVVEGTEPPAGRGRPPLRYVVDPAIDSRWGATGPYERLSLLLSEIIRTGDHPVEVGRRAGHRARLGAEPHHHDPVDQFVEQMARHGFAPSVSHLDGSVEIVLQSCPFESTALADPGTVCQLHLGLAYGIADVAAGESARLVVDELVPRDPRRAQCRLRCHLTPTGPATDG